MKLTDNLINHNSLYVLINIFVSTVGFLRSFVFMKYLDDSNLGIISLIQTVVMFLGLFQLGLLNGGYRIFALDKAEQQRSINNVLFTYFGLLGGAAILFWSVLVVCKTQIIISNTQLGVALICGILTLIMGWLTNTLIGKRLIKNINWINSISAIISFVFLPLVMVWGIAGAIVSLIVQPLIFITITLIRHKDLRPSAWNFDLKLIRYILSFGFIPFLAGIFTAVNLQAERWSIAKILGTEALGEFYLTFMYTTLFMLVPTSLNSLFFPKSVKAYEEHNIGLFQRYLKQYILILLGYATIVVIVTLTLLQPMVDWIFPQHSLNTVYVFYFLPGLVVSIFCDPIGLIMNATVKLRPMLITGVVSLITNISLIYLVNLWGMFDLTTMTFIKDIVNTTIFLFYCLFLLSNLKLILGNNTKIKTLFK